MYRRQAFISVGLSHLGAVAFSRAMSAVYGKG
jgi:hypothetical protein